jgi:hypothetical protein
MYQTTGLAREQLADLCELIRMEIGPMKQISRAATTATPLIGQVLAKFVPTADELGDQEQYIVDGTLPAPSLTS